MPDNKTGGNQPEIPGNQPMTEAELLRYIASQAEAVLEAVRDLEKRVDHVDEQAHAIDQKVTALTGVLEQYRPLLERAQKLASSPLWPARRPPKASP